MGKQRVMVRVTMRDGKSRSKALRTAVALPGVTSAAVEGDMVIVVGDGIDSVALTVMLRKQMGFAELHRVAPFDEKQEKKGSNSDGMGKNMQVLPSQVSSTYAYAPYPSTYQNHDPYYNQSCNIM